MAKKSNRKSADKNRLHLLCNAHLDPCWMWEWEEGAAAAMATFRQAAIFCEEYDGFVFNHNEVILYEWVEEYEPALFKKIQKLVKQGRWHIIGGWYLQPDCNMPSGESFVRQMLVGRTYFRNKFGVEPRTAINFDPFGHTRGLVQLLKKAGYDSYLFCRPFQNDCPLPSDDFTWVGYDGSTVTGHRASMFYNHPLGQARAKVERWMAENKGKRVGLVLWGVGNHGGGPSREDLNMLGQLRAECADYDIVDSTPENYFDELRASGTPLPRHEKDINLWGPGCYTSQVRIKQKHRLLENTLYSTEKMCSHAALSGLMKYPYAELQDAQRDLLQAEFHDIIPGSSIANVEDAGLRLMDHGLEILSRVRARAFFALSEGQPKTDPEEIPILVYNPHPFPVKGVFECEFQLPDAKWEDQFTIAHAHQNGKPLPSQTEQEYGNMNLDWRKHVVFEAELAPGQMNRFDCTLEVLPERPKPALKMRKDAVVLKTDRLEVVISRKTGLIDTYRVDGVDYLKPGACKPIVIQDNEDPWETRYRSFRDVMGEFKLMSAKNGAAFSGQPGRALESVRIIEDGAVRTVVEVLMEFNYSFAVITYKIPKNGTEIEIHVRALWNEKTRMLKLSFPTPFGTARYVGQVAYGHGPMLDNGDECVNQKWAAVMDDKADAALTVIDNGLYGSDYKDGELRISLLRGAAYSCHPIGERPLIREDRFIPRIDQGEREFRFWLNVGTVAARTASIDREALVRNEKPFAISFAPPGVGKVPAPLATLSDDCVQLTAFKRAEDSPQAFVVRLFEPTGSKRTTTLCVPSLGIRQKIALKAFEVKTFRVDAKAKTIVETSLLER